jgi:arsenate reductase
MAEGFAKALLEPLKITVRSAGIAPTRVNHWAVRVMAEEGIDITAQWSKPLDSIVASMVDKLVLMEPDLPIPPRFHRIPRIEWRIDDPNAVPVSSDAMLRNFRKIRDDIEVSFLKWIASKAAQMDPGEHERKALGRLVPNLRDREL